MIPLMLLPALLAVGALAETEDASRRAPRTVTPPRPATSPDPATPPATAPSLTPDADRLQAAAAKRARKAEKLRATWTGRRLLVMTRNTSTQVSLEQELGRRTGEAAP